MAIDDVIKPPFLAFDRYQGPDEILFVIRVKGFPDIIEQLLYITFFPRVRALVGGNFVPNLLCQNLTDCALGRFHYHSSFGR